jgi:hypothetical protein
VDRIAGYWRWQDSIAEICGKEAERLAARKKAAEGPLDRLKGMLLAFMLFHGAKKLEGEKAAIGMQANGMASLVIDDPSQLGECFFENSIRFTKTELSRSHLSANGRRTAASPGDGPGIQGLGDQHIRGEGCDDRQLCCSRSEAREGPSCAAAVSTTSDNKRARRIAIWAKIKT